MGASSEAGRMAAVRLWPTRDADVPLADEIKQWQAEAFVVVGDFDDQAQVGLDHLLAGFLVALFDAGSQFNFLFGREQFDEANLAQVKFDSRIAVVARALLLDR